MRRAVVCRPPCRDLRSRPPELVASLILAIVDDDHGICVRPRPRVSRSGARRSLRQSRQLRQSSGGALGHVRARRNCATGSARRGPSCCAGRRVTMHGFGNDPARHRQQERPPVAPAVDLLSILAGRFEEIRLPLDTPRFREEIGRYSPTGRVPALLTAPCGCGSRSRSASTDEATQPPPPGRAPGGASSLPARSAPKCTRIPGPAHGLDPKAASSRVCGRLILTQPARADLCHSSRYERMPSPVRGTGPMALRHQSIADAMYVRSCCVSTPAPVRSSAAPRGYFSLRAARPVASRADPGCRTGAR